MPARQAANSAARRLDEVELVVEMAALLEDHDMAAVAAPGGHRIHARHRRKAPLGAAGWIEIAQIKVEIDAVAGVAGIGDAYPVGREGAPLVDRLRPRRQRHRRAAVAREEMQLLALVAAAIDAIDDGIAARRARQERHRLVVEGELASPAATKIERPDLPLAAIVGEMQQLAAVAGEGRRQRGSNLDQAIDEGGWRH